MRPTPPHRPGLSRETEFAHWRGGSASDKPIASEKSVNKRESVMLDPLLALPPRTSGLSGWMHMQDSGNSSSPLGPRSTGGGVHGFRTLERQSQQCHITHLVSTCDATFPDVTLEPSWQGCHQSTLVVGAELASCTCIFEVSVKLLFSLCQG